MKTILLSSRKFLVGCGLLAVGVLVAGSQVSYPPALIAIEIFATVLGLFLLGSFKYRLDKNALTAGSALIVCATFASRWPLDLDLLSFRGLDALIHLDTLLFILGLTFFVSVVARTRLLQNISLAIFQRAGGGLFVTIALITALVAVLSGILDGVSMIGLLIRVLVILLALARMGEDDVVFFVVLSTMITTICGMWLAYGEPPNLIMKANLAPRLSDGFFLRYCLPTAVASYAVLWLHMRRRLAGRVVAEADIARARASLYAGVEPSSFQSAQRWAMAAFVPFVALLAAHAVNHNIPLFVSSAAGFAAALPALWRLPAERRAALREGAHEFQEYLFLIPLFFSIALLTRTGFFDAFSAALHAGTESSGPGAMAFAQFFGATALSAILDNNVVADVASRALHGFADHPLFLYAMAQIAGYALGGCWTHIGSAQSVVGFSFIQKSVRPAFTPMNWIRVATPLLLQIFAAATALIFFEAWMLG